MELADCSLKRLQNALQFGVFAMVLESHDEVFHLAVWRRAEEKLGLRLALSSVQFLET